MGVSPGLRAKGCEGKLYCACYRVTVGACNICVGECTCKMMFNEVRIKGRHIRGGVADCRLVSTCMHIDSVT